MTRYKFTKNSLDLDVIRIIYRMLCVGKRNRRLHGKPAGCIPTAAVAGEGGGGWGWGYPSRYSLDRDPLDRGPPVGNPPPRPWIDKHE